MKILATKENCEEIIKRFNPQLENLTTEKYEKLRRYVKQEREGAKETLKLQTSNMIYNYLAKVYIEKNKEIGTFEDALAEAYLIVNDIFKKMEALKNGETVKDLPKTFYSLDKLPKDFGQYAKFIRVTVKSTFKSIDKQNKKRNADLCYKPEKIERNINDVIDDGRYTFASSTKAF